MPISRKKALQNIAGIAALSVTGLPELSAKARPPLSGRINHSVCRWCFDTIPLDSFCEQVADMGIKSVELLVEDEWAVAQKYGLTCAMGTYLQVSLTEGFNDPAQHARLHSDYRQLIPKAADAGLPNIIVFSGNTNGLTDEEGLENCARGLEPMVKLAEEVGVTICMELFNTKVDHPGYQCDSSDWACALVDKIGSDRFKLLYDIYHMQIMEGDIIATIRKHKDYFAHYHTAGVPGRHEIDTTQELNYRAIMQAIVDTGFDGYVAQEFIPTAEDKLGVLRDAIEICDV